MPLLRRVGAHLRLLAAGSVVPHRYKVREIVEQSGVSEATVDRVLNGRPGVRENTRAEVAQAIADLDEQRAQRRLNGHRFLIDVVMQTPQRFSDAFRAAVEAELPAFAPAMLRARFHLWESGSTAQMADVLARIRGSHGVVLKAQDGTTICAPTPAWRCGRSCSTTAPSPPSRLGPRRSQVITPFNLPS